MKRVAKIVTKPATTAITLAEAKDQCGVTFDDDDTKIAIYINMATALVENTLQRRLITQTWNMFLDSWPTNICPLFGDLQSVVHIKYTDVDDEQSTFSSDNYYVDTNSVPGRILLKDGVTWPTDTLNINNPIEIQFVTGYGDATTDIPDDIRGALLLTTAHFYENRENLVINEYGTASAIKIPGTADTLLANHRVWGWIV